MSLGSVSFPWQVWAKKCSRKGNGQDRAPMPVRGFSHDRAPMPKRRVGQDRAPMPEMRRRTSSSFMHIVFYFNVLLSGFGPYMSPMHIPVS